MEPNLTDSWEEEIQNYTNEVDLQWGGVIEGTLKVEIFAIWAIHFHVGLLFIYFEILVMWKDYCTEGVLIVDFCFAPNLQKLGHK